MEKMMCFLDWKKRADWALVKMIERSLENCPEEVYGVRTAWLEECKRTIRASYREDLKRSEENPDPICYSKDYNTWFIKIFFDEPFSEAEKEEFIEENWPRIDSQYDLYGIPFTSGIKFFNLREANGIGAKSVVYIRYEIE